MRSPRYRSSRLLRFHPYPRINQGEVLMQTTGDFTNCETHLTADLFNNQCEEGVTTSPTVVDNPEEHHDIDVDSLESTTNEADTIVQPPARTSISITIIVGR